MLLYFKLALRFVLSRRKGKLTRFMSFASTCGIAIGVFAAIIGFSAMNGFEYELEHRVLSVVPSAELKSGKGYFRDLPAIEQVLKESPSLVAFAPALDLRVVMVAHRSFAPLSLVGIQPERERQVVAVERFVPEGLEIIAQPSSDFNIIIGAGVAKKLKLKKGDTVELMLLPAEDETSYQELSQSLKAPQKHHATVAGFIEIGGQLDSVMALMNIDDVASIASLPAPNAIHIKTVRWQESRELVLAAISGKVKEYSYLSTWMTTQGKLYHDIQMVRQIMFIAMFLVIAVACFNIVSNLLMMVRDKRREVAILLTMGMTRRALIQVFSLVGLLSAFRGVALGLFFGIGCALVLEPLTSSFEDWFGFTLLNPEVYFISFIPCRLALGDVLFVLGLSFCMSLLASIYPAVSASRIKPAEELSLH